MEYAYRSPNYFRGYKSKLNHRKCLKKSTSREVLFNYSRGYNSKFELWELLNEFSVT